MDLLPDEILCHIFSYLSPSINYHLISKHLLSICENALDVSTNGNEYLIKFCTSNRPDLVRRLYKYRNFNPTINGSIALFCACEYDDLVIARMLAEDKRLIRNVNDNKMLKLACICGIYKVMNFLIDDIGIIPNDRILLYICINSKLFNLDENYIIPDNMKYLRKLINDEHFKQMNSKLISIFRQVIIDNNGAAVVGYEELLSKLTSKNAKEILEITNKYKLSNLLTEDPNYHFVSYLINSRNTITG